MRGWGETLIFAKWTFHKVHIRQRFILNLAYREKREKNSTETNNLILVSGRDKY